MNEFLFGAAYYDEYMPYERMDTDFQLMKEAGMNVIRIAESTWSTWEPEEGVFDFTKLQNMLDKALEYDLKVIVGTPTYAIPAWLYNKYPDILAVTAKGESLYGTRQQNDITNEHYLFYAERMIRKMMEVVADHPTVIGYQLDNEVRSAGAAGPGIQKKFVQSLKDKYGTVEAFNHEFGTDFWSTRIGKWEDFPDVRGTINGSLSAAYKRFLRDCITEFIEWQANIVREYAKEGQFLTHNFDYEWRDYSVGLQPLQNQVATAKPLDVAGCDIYYPTQDDFTGAEHAMCGAIAYSIKKDNFLLLETHPQGKKVRTHYPGQLKLAMYSNIAAGASANLYWHWHSIHNAAESYWKGILSHDLLPNEPYKEIKDTILNMPAFIKDESGIKPDNQVAIILDNNSLTGIDEFPFDEETGLTYNDVVRSYFDACYMQNIHCDVVYAGDNVDKYKLLIVPALYSATDETINWLRKYVENGGHILMSFKSLFSDEEIKIYADAQPHNFTDLCGFTYDQFTAPGRATIQLDGEAGEETPREWIELLRVSEGTEVWGRYNHPYWNRYAAVTHKNNGNGSVTYVGSYMERESIAKIVSKLANVIGLDKPDFSFPIIKRNCIKPNGDKISFIFNYSSEARTVTINGKDISLSDWDVFID